jgi:hypothetical protein
MLLSRQSDMPTMILHQMIVFSINKAGERISIPLINPDYGHSGSGNIFKTVGTISASFCLASFQRLTVNYFLDLT